MSAERPGVAPLLAWLQTYRVPAPCATYQDLASGVALAQVLHRIDASWFSQSWLGCIRDNTGNDPRVKVSNLTKVLQSMLEYCQDVLGQPVPERHVPEVAVAAEQAAAPELDKLLRLVLGCAVACERKQEHIQQIMTLEESVQHVVMAAIQELMTRDSLDTMSPEMYGTFDSQSRRYYFLSEEPDEPDVPCRRCQDLEQQVAALAEAARGRHETEVGGAARNLLLLQARVEQLQEENYRLESGREELRGHCEGLQRELGALRQRSQELGDLAKEAQALRDEMDMLR
ncbi:hypothetical protein Y1Q_0002214 [Alligator mississippiensis]|uniref:Calponin-homology (CH) domain-containing protein n=1 Tax=Alligator mississippiensis TaxID=8496 RepID=A0A151MWD7_ALLMI|nr:hypothetical protein Y1Q_0002214 [Alligator mississippiensis]